LPSNTGEFSSEVYKSLINFIIKAKEILQKPDLSNLYPIEIISHEHINLENQDYLSIYFAVDMVSDGLPLIEAIRSARKMKPMNINENIIQFIYNYFGVSDAYRNPDETQKANAKNWKIGKYNKIKQYGIKKDSWVSIDPLTEGGKFVALSRLPDSDDYKPHPEPNNWSTMSKRQYDSFKQVSVDFSGSLQVAAVFNSNVNFNTITIIRDVALYSDISSNEGGDKIIETRYGIGVRLILKVSDIEFGTEINYGTVGAASEFRHANVEYEISGIGINEPTILAELPNPQDINQDTIEEINGTFKKILKKLSKLDMSKLRPQPFMIRVNEPEKVDPTLHAQAFVLAMNKVANRARLKDVLSEVSMTGIPSEIITNTYKEEFGISDINDRPSFKQRNEAKSWLNYDRNN
jgi:hypothetical protein